MNEKRFKRILKRLRRVQKAYWRFKNRALRRLTNKICKTHGIEGDFHQLKYRLVLAMGNDVTPERIWKDIMALIDWL